MTEESVLILRGDKCAEIIKSISELFGVTICFRFLYGLPLSVSTIH